MYRSCGSAEVSAVGLVHLLMRCLLARREEMKDGRVAIRGSVLCDTNTVLVAIMGGDYDTCTRVD